MTAIFEHIAPYATKAALAREPVPWLVELPNSLWVDWDSYRLHFLKIVGGRPVTAPDRWRMELRVRRVQIRGDSLVAEFSIGNSHRCGEWFGDYNAYEIQSVREGASWQPARITREIISDGIPCPALDTAVLRAPRKPPRGPKLGL